MDIDVNGVSITLTKQQLAEIAKHIDKKTVSYTDIKSVEDACKYLNNISNHDGINHCDVIDLRDLIINAYRLGREHELDNCGDKQDKRDKKTNREKKESA